MVFMEAVKGQLVVSICPKASGTCCRESIATFDDLKNVAERIDQFPGIEPKMALVVREEIARVAVLNGHAERGRPHNPWQAA
jgi:hypothetical protein